MRSKNFTKFSMLFNAMFALTATKFKMLDNSKKNGMNLINEKNTAEYYERKRDKIEVEPLILKAIQQVKEQNPDQELRALDLGTATGAVAVHMAREGFKVTAVDKHPKALEITASRATELNLSIETKQLTVGEDELPKQMHLVTASLLLPYILEDKMEKAVGSALDSVVPGGCFAGNFFKNPHPWCKYNDVNCPSPERIKQLLSRKDFEAELYDSDREIVPGWTQTNFLTCRRK